MKVEEVLPPTLTLQPPIVPCAGEGAGPPTTTTPPTAFSIGEESGQPTTTTIASDPGAPEPLAEHLSTDTWALTLTPSHASSK
jgi:hypothetical protein